MISDIEKIQKLAETKFNDIIKSTLFIGYKLRIILIDNSFIDINVSKILKNKFGFHWETTKPDKSFYRYDNFPDQQWKNLKTFPFHFHNGNQNDVIESPFPEDLIEGFESFMEFIKRKIPIR